MWFKIHHRRKDKTMKRTPLKRGNSVLKAKTPLKRGTKKLRTTGRALITKWRKKADDSMGKLIRSIGFCQAKGLDSINCGGMLQWCHIITRSNYRLRHEFYNSLCMCSGHHVYYTNHPWEWREFIEHNFPKHFEFVQAHRNEILKGSVEYYSEIVERTSDENS